MKLSLATALAVLCSLAVSAPADASRYVRYGVQDDAWLAAGPGDFWSRLAELDRLGVDVYRFTLRWDRVARKRPENARDPNDAAYDWSFPDAVVHGLRAHGIAPVVTIWGTPRWANGGRSANWAPTSKWSLASFAYAAARRYRAEVNEWLVWNEPNQQRWLRPTSPRTYTALLNVAYPAIKSGDSRARVGAGVTAPRGNVGGVSPVDWIRGMKRARARLDAYAHNPYPTRPRTETPWSGGCAWCETITMADLNRLIREVQRAWPGKRIWLTEYGYQTNPPDRWLGVSPALQATYLGAASLRAYQAPYVDMLIHFMVADDGKPGGWQSGLRTLTGTPKPAYAAFRLPLAQVSRRGLTTTVWGQVRPRAGRQAFRLQQWRSGAWRWVGGRRVTDGRGFFRASVRAGRGSRLRVWSYGDAAFGTTLVVR
jgi:hypothetical protein